MTSFHIHVPTSQTVANQSQTVCVGSIANTHFLRLCLRSCFPYAWLLYATWSHDIVRKGRKNKSRINFCVVINFLLCRSCCEDGGREEVSRDAPIFIRFTLFWGVSSLPQLYSDAIFITYTCLALIHQSVSRAQKYRRLIANNQKQFKILFPYRCFLAFALLLVANKT